MTYGRRNTYSDISQSAESAGNAFGSAVVQCAPDPREAGAILGEFPSLAHGVVFPICIAFIWVFLSSVSNSFFSFVDNWLIDVIGLLFFAMFNLVLLVGVFSYPMKFMEAQHYTPTGVAIDSCAPVITQMSLTVTALISYMIFSFELIETFSWQCIFSISLYFIISGLFKKSLRRKKNRNRMVIFYAIMSCWAALNSLGLTFHGYSGDGRSFHHDLDSVFYLPACTVMELTDVTPYRGCNRIFK